MEHNNIKSFPYKIMNETIRDVMKDIFKFTMFKSTYQRDGILAVLKDDHDVFINLPPNSGKSLCYQLPAIIAEGKSAIIFVHNSNIAQEHINSFIGKNINVCHIDSLLQNKKRQERIEELISGKLVASLIYIPVSHCHKSWIKNFIMTLGDHNLISIFGVDEAVYISHNSSNFNKQYLYIPPLRNMLPNVPLVALSSSCSKQIKSDIFNSLFIKNPLEIIHDQWFLENIYIQVKFKDIISNPYEDLIELINAFKQSIQRTFCGIIFCRTTNETIVVAQELSRLRIPTVAYNTSMKMLNRKKNRSMWKVGKAMMIAVTAESATGLNKSNVMCIIHWSVPPSIFQYYHEIGKAGKDGVKALCCLYFSLNDWMYMKGLTMGMSSHVHDNSEKMIQFCLSEECRHKMYLKHFESRIVSCENSCDWCVEKNIVKNSLKAFNEFQAQHRLRSLNPPKYIGNNSDIGVYAIQKTENIINDIRPGQRLYWYNKLANALKKNDKMTQYSTNQKMSLRNLYRLARSMEYLKFCACYKKATYIYAMSSMVDAINKQTMRKNHSFYISNYDCVVAETSMENIDENTENVLRTALRKT